MCMCKQIFTHSFVYLPCILYCALEIQLKRKTVNGKQVKSNNCALLTSLARLGLRPVPNLNSQRIGSIMRQL